MDLKTTQVLQETLKDLTQNAEKSMLEFAKQAEKAGQGLAKDLNKNSLSALVEKELLKPPQPKISTTISIEFPAPRSKETLKSKAKNFFSNLFVK